MIVTLMIVMVMMLLSCYCKTPATEHLPFSLTFGLAVSEGQGALLLGHESPAAGEAEDAPRLRLVRPQGAGQARPEPVRRRLTRRTLTWGTGGRPSH